jgi:hypothetical protein
LKGAANVRDGLESKGASRAPQIVPQNRYVFKVSRSLGPLWLGEPDELTHPSHRAWFGSRVSEILRHSAAEARRALIENRPSLERLAKALFDASYLDAAQIRDALALVKTIELRPSRHTDETNREGKDRDSERQKVRGRSDDKTSSNDQAPQRN